MTPQETAQCIAILSSAFPAWEITEPTIELWAHESQRISPEVGREAALVLTRTAKRPPSLAEFLDAVRSEQRRSVHVSPGEALGLPAGGKRQRELNTRGQAALREVARMKATADETKGHHHRPGRPGDAIEGGEPICPACARTAEEDLVPSECVACSALSAAGLPARHHHH